MDGWAASTGLTWTQFDDSPHWVVYNAESGSVHLLTEPARLLWTLIADSQTATTDELLPALAALLGRPLDSELSTAAIDTLRLMDAVGLVQPVAG